MPSNNLVETIERLEEFIKPFHPPVFAFEAGSRRTPFRTLVSVLLSSRTRDEVTHQAAEKLFQEAETPAAMLSLGEERIAELIYPVGFYRQKAKNIIAICRQLNQTGGVPDDFDRLVELPGVGRKTANLILAIAFERPAVAVDIHVFRISRRLGWARGDKPEVVESELMALFPRRYWRRINQVLVGFGQTVCKPRIPRCDICILRPECPYYAEQSKKRAP